MLFQVIISHRLILNLILVSTVGGVQSQIWLAVSIGFAVIVPIFAEIQNSSFFFLLLKADWPILRILWWPLLIGFCYVYIF